MSAIDSRMSSGAGEGVIARSPVARLVTALGDDAAGEFHDWACSRFGVLVVAALRHMALHGPAQTSGADTSVQYGVTLGLSLAADLLSDPSSVVSGVFRGPQLDAGALVPEYAVAPDELELMQRGESNGRE